MDLEWEEQFKDLTLKMKPSEYWRRQCRATYQSDPVGLRLIKDVLPKYSNLAMGEVEKGLTQGVNDQVGDQLLINTLYLEKTGELDYDARIRIMPHPVSKKILYASYVGYVKNTKEYVMLAQDAVINPKMHQKEFKPVRSKG